MHAIISEANQLALRTVSKRLVGGHKHPALTFPIATTQPASLQNRNIKRKKNIQHRRHWISFTSHSLHQAKCTIPFTLEMGKERSFFV